MVETGIFIIDQILFVKPLTSITIVACIIIWIYVNQKNIPVESIAFNYESLFLFYYPPISILF